MLAVIPVETVLAVLSFIPLRQLERLRGLSREWILFFSQNEPSIYHAAATLHGFVSSYASLSQSIAIHALWLAEVHTWKDLCKKHYALERRWEASEPPNFALINAAGENIHRFKIDTEQRTVITTHFDGGLRVCGIDEDEIMWDLPRSTVHQWSHCEFDNGFLVFTRIGHSMEVWRRKRDACNSLAPPTLEPDVFQLNASQLSWQSTLSVSQDNRGAFVPWTIILPPNPVHALRLVFPILLVASPSAQEAYLYDVVTGLHKQTISLRSSQDPLASVNYVELGPRHIFVCTDTDVLILPRDTGHSHQTLRFPSHGIDGFYPYKITTLGGSDLLPENDLPALEELNLLPPPYMSGPRPSYGSFTAVHVSPCGSHFVAADMEGLLYLVRDFEEAIHRRLPLSRCVTVVAFGSPITYLALDGDRRICIHVQGRGNFIVPFFSPDAVPVNTLDMHPHRSYPRVLQVSSIGVYDHSSCVQLTGTEVWTKMPIEPAGIHGIGRNKLCFLDFTKPQHP